MSAPLTIGRSLCWRGKGETAEIDSYTRVLEEAGQVWLMIANACHGGFEITSPFMTRGLLDKACESLRATTGLDNIANRFERTFEACERFVGAQSGNEDYESAGGSLCVVRVGDADAMIHWLGGEEAWIVRKRRVIGRSVGHAPSDAVGLGFGRARTSESFYSSWGSAENGRIILLTRSVVEALSEESIMRIVENGTVRECAHAIIEQFKVASQASHGAVVVTERGDATR